MTNSHSLPSTSRASQKGTVRRTRAASQHAAEQRLPCMRAQMLPFQKSEKGSVSRRPVRGGTAAKHTVAMWCVSPAATSCPPLPGLPKREALNPARKYHNMQPSNDFRIRTPQHFPSKIRKGKRFPSPFPHPSSLIPHPSSLIPYPLSLIPYPSSLIPHPSVPPQETAKPPAKLAEGFTIYLHSPGAASSDAHRPQWYVRPLAPASLLAKLCTAAAGRGATAALLAAAIATTAATALAAPLFAALLLAALVTAAAIATARRLATASRGGGGASRGRATTALLAAAIAATVVVVAALFAARIAAAVAALLATAAIVAAAGIATTTAAVSTAANIAQHGSQALERERLRRHTDQTDRHHGGQHTALHGETPQLTETQGDGNGNTLSPEPPAPRCSWQFAAAVTVTVSDAQHTPC
jgi:hypothetical protein